MNNKFEFITTKPNDKLQKFISYYYFKKQTNKDKEIEFVYFPHYKNGLTIYQNYEAKNKLDYVLIKPNNKIKYSIFYSTTHKSPQKVKIQGTFDKIGIAFNPLGINNFISGNLSSKIINNDFRFEYFGQDLEDCLDLVYNETEISKKTKLLDVFFISKLDFFDNSIIKKAIDFIHSTDEKLTVQFTANELGVNRRTLLREFNKHLCCSIKTYIDVVQFRKAFMAYEKSENKPSLTLLSYDFNYFDQSELLKHFKKLTNNNPSQLFKNTDQLGNEDTFWQIKK